MASDPNDFLHGAQLKRSDPLLLLLALEGVDPAFVAGRFEGDGDEFPLDGLCCCAGDGWL